MKQWPAGVNFCFAEVIENYILRMKDIVAYIRRRTQILFSMFQIFITLCTSRQSHAICLTIKVSRHIKWLIDN